MFMYIQDLSSTLLMDQLSQKYSLHDSSQIPPPMITPPSSLLGSTLHSSHSGFPIIAVAIIGILATGFLLVSYYIFVIKCCLNWHRIDLLRRFSFSRRQRVEDSLMDNSPAVENRGLDEAAIRSIPIFQYKKFITGKGEPGERSFCECAVCLNEFQEEEKLRVIPNCAHVFHIDCIDVWLQNNANCPLCRTSISVTTRFPLDQIMAPISFFPLEPSRHRDNFTGRDEDYVVIEIGEHNRSDRSLLRVQERLNSEESSGYSVSPSPRKLSEQKISQKKEKKFSHVSSMGDECIDIRKKDERFVIQPIRRSFSLDSAADPHLSLAVQEIIQQQGQISDVTSPSSEGCSSRLRRSFFTFGHGRTSRSAVLPVHLEP